MKKLLFLFTLSMYLFPISFAGDNEDYIRVMTYNIRYAGDEKAEGINSWNNRKQLIASVIRFHKADIVGLQEALKIQLDDLAIIFPEFGWVGVGRDDGAEAGEYSAICYNKERLEVLEDSNFWLSESPEKPSKGWDAALNRIVTWAKFKDKVTDKVFYHFNTHFDHQGEMARLESANLLKNKVMEIAAENPAIINGDFNFKPDSKGYKILTGSMNNYLLDAQKISKHGHYGSNITFNDFGKSNEEGNKIDFIFIKNNIEVIQHGVISETFDGRFPSDHMPVLAEIRIN